MVLKRIKLQEALGHLLIELEILAPESKGSDPNGFYRDLYWQAQVYSFLDVDVWSGIESEPVIREMIIIKLGKIRKNIEYVFKIEQNKQKKALLNSILDNLKGFNGKNGCLEDVIEQIIYLNDN
jgi:hypothetical protein